MQDVELGERILPERTSSMPGWYSPRQASAKASQSSVWPSGASSAFASRAIEVRQSASVPNTSKNNASTIISETLYSCA